MTVEIKLINGNVALLNGVEKNRNYMETPILLISIKKKQFL